MENRTIQVTAPMNKKLSLPVIRGHFATCHSHVNLYTDITNFKSNFNEATEVAKLIAEKYMHNKVVDTIVCLDGCEVIATCVAATLCNGNLRRLNEKESIHIVSAEYNTHGQLFFRENIQPFIYEKYILIIAGSVTTGYSIEKSLNSIKYYGGNVIGIHAIFSALNYVVDKEINSIYKTKDLPQYETYSIGQCPHCLEKKKIDALVDSYGYIRM